MGNACCWRGTYTRKRQNHQSEPRLLCRPPVNHHPVLPEIRGEPYIHAVMVESGQPRARKGKRNTLETTVPKEMSVHIYMVGPRLRQVSQQVQSRTKQYLVTTKPFSPQARLLQKRCMLHESMATVKRRKTLRHQCHRRVYRTIRRLLETGRLLQQVAAKLSELELE